MTQLLKRRYLKLMATGAKTLEARLLRSNTSFTAKVEAGHTVTFQAGNDPNGAPERLVFEVLNCTRYGCASDMLAAVDMHKLVPDATSTEEALVTYWRISTQRWSAHDTTRAEDKTNSSTACYVTRAANKLAANTANTSPAARASHLKLMEGALRDMGVRPPTYKWGPMLATYKWGPMLAVDLYMYPV